MLISNRSTIQGVSLFISGIGLHQIHKHFFKFRSFNRKTVGNIDANEESNNMSTNYSPSDDFNSITGSNKNVVESTTMKKSMIYTRTGDKGTTSVSIVA